MDWGIIKELLMFLLPGGALGSVVTYVATHRERKVNVLGKLQESIDLLTKKYTEVLDENIQLKADNAKLLAGQKILQDKIEYLTEQVSKLTRQIKRKENEIESAINADPGQGPAARPSAKRGVRSGKASDGIVQERVQQGGVKRVRRPRERKRQQLPEQVAVIHSDGSDGDEDDRAGGSPGGESGGDGGDSEPH